jgi:hypothetical protein
MTSALRTRETHRRFRTAGLQDCRTAGLQNCRIAELQKSIRRKGRRVEKSEVLGKKAG